MSRVDGHSPNQSLMMYFQCLLLSGEDHVKRTYCCYQELGCTTRTEAAGRDIGADVDAAKVVLLSYDMAIDC